MAENKHQEPMQDDEWDFIRIRSSTKSLLDSMKVHTNQSYNEVIHELIMQKKEAI